MLAMAAGLVARTFDLQFGENEHILVWARDHRMQESAVMGVRGDILDRSGDPLARRLSGRRSTRIPPGSATRWRWRTPWPPPSVPMWSRWPRRCRCRASSSTCSGRCPPRRPRLCASWSLDGVGTVPELRRTYPLGDFAVEIVGSVSTDHAGISGIELLHDDVLARPATVRSCARCIRAAAACPAGSASRCLRSTAADRAAHHRWGAAVRSSPHPGGAGARDRRGRRGDHPRPPGNRRDPGHVHRNPRRLRGEW